MIRLLVLCLPTVLTLIVCPGCRRERPSCEVEEAPKIPEPMDPAEPPSARDIEENRRLLAAIRALRQRELKESDVPWLIRMLDPVVHIPPPDVRRLPEGYAHAEAEEALRDLGPRAFPALIEAIRSNDKARDTAFSIMASQGQKAALDELFALPDAGGKGSTIGICLGWDGPIDIARMKAWYAKNRDRLVFDARLGTFRLREEDR